MKLKPLAAAILALAITGISTTPSADAAPADTTPGGAILVAAAGQIVASAAPLAVSAVAKATTTPAPAAVAPVTGSYDPDAPIRATIAAVNANAKIASIKPTPIQGLKEVVADGTVVYISNDGRYLFHGVLLDVAQRQNLTEVAGAVGRKQLLDTIPDDEKIKFKPAGQPKYTVTVFTDVSCHYCQELHKHIADYLAKGIEVDYVPFPREGTSSPAYGQMIAVWCAKDRNDAYNHAIAGQAVPALACAHPVEKDFNLGEKLNIEGTPAIYTASGIQLGGYVPPEQMFTALQAEDARAHPVQTPAPAAAAAANAQPAIAAKRP
jgi:thiol:disulfide interchange protein DsbC